MPEVTITVEIEVSVEYQVSRESYGDDADGNRGTVEEVYTPLCAEVLTKHVPAAAEAYAKTAAIELFESNPAKYFHTTCQCGKIRTI